jgi:hypothetical protein
MTILHTKATCSSLQKIAPLQRMNGFSQSGEALAALFAGNLYEASLLVPFILQVLVWTLAFFIVRCMLGGNTNHGRYT